MTRVPVRFAKIEGGNGKSQLVAVIQGSDSISMALNKESRDVVKGITGKYNKLVRSLSGNIEKLRPEGPAVERLEASKLLDDFVKETSDRFDLVAFPESIARDLNLKARQNEANALLSLADVAKKQDGLSKGINWRTFIFVHPAITSATNSPSNTLIGDLTDIIDKQAELAYRGKSLAAGSVSRQLFELALKHRLEIVGVDGHGRNLRVGVKRRQKGSPLHRPARVRHRPASVHHRPARVRRPSRVRHRPARVHHRPARVRRPVRVRHRPARVHRPSPVRHRPARVHRPVRVHHRPARVHHRPARVRRPSRVRLPPARLERDRPHRGSRSPLVARHASGRQQSQGDHRHRVGKCRR